MASDVLHQHRTFARSALACGSVVLYRYCGLFFRPAGQKKIHKELNMIGKRKSSSNGD
jgi:hypothetical protein